jgi:hypothetical protein
VSPLGCETPQQPDITVRITSPNGLPLTRWFPVGELGILMMTAMTIGIHATVSALWLVKKLAKTGLFLSLPLYGCGVSVSTAAESVPISTLLPKPSAYQLKVVSVDGRVGQVILYEPHPQGEAAWQSLTIPA